MGVMEIQTLVAGLVVSAGSPGNGGYITLGEDDLGNVERGIDGLEMLEVAEGWHR